MSEISAARIKELDSLGMWQLVTNFPDFWDQAIEFSAGFTSDIAKESITNIVIAGMGGSAGGGMLSGNSNTGASDEVSGTAF